jgi:endonuclease/exonuclease/phosphatase family metal-dependent hydrolase
MKKLFLSSVSLLFALAMSAQSIFVGTYNIRYQNSGDEKNGNVWATRCKVICDMINFEAPDVFGTQEVLIGQLRDLRAGLDNYDFIGVGRDDGKEAGEYSALFYKKDHLTLLNNGNFWLNETPDKPKLGWDAACIRICTWGEFKQKQTGFHFFHFNLHMDHVGIVARREAAKLIVKKIREIAKGTPVIVTGDFNVDQNNEIFKIFTDSGILKDSYSAARLRFAENGTFNSFDTDLWSSSRIDHVFVSPEFAVDRYGILTNAYWTQKEADAQKGNDAPSEIELNKRDRRAPSDHYPVMVHMEYKK